MNAWNRTLSIAFAAAILVVVSEDPVFAQTAGVDQCRLEYTRANNMWGSLADSYKSLGTESITLQPGQKKAFVTDWRFEKTRNDGSTYYGSHGRSHVNRGTRVLKVTYKPDAIRILTFYLEPGQSSTFASMSGEAARRGDIVEVACP
jgi:hypothetical protein